MQAAPLARDGNRKMTRFSPGKPSVEPTEKDYKGLAQLITEVSGCKFALVSLSNGENYSFRTGRQLAVKDIVTEGLSWSKALIKEDIVVVTDAKKDKRILKGQRPTGNKIGFFAGAPIINAAGSRIGTVCAMDNIAKAALTVHQENALKIIAKQVNLLFEIGAKNRRILAETEALVAEEKKIVQITISGQDDEKDFIVNELHENFAQTLAATKLYLDSAEQSKELSSDYIKESKKNILQIIREMKALSKSMLPSTFQNANYFGFIQETLNEYGRQNQKKISFRHSGKLDCYDAGIGLTILRVIQYQLKNAQHCGASNVSITIRTGELITLEITDDGKNIAAFSSERTLNQQHIAARVAMVKGNYRVSVDTKRRNRLMVKIPLAPGS
jgi:signal transduction histidine kinase